MNREIDESMIAQSFRNVSRKFMNLSNHFVSKLST